MVGGGDGAAPILGRPLSFLRRPRTAARYPCRAAVPRLVLRLAVRGSRTGLPGLSRPIRPRAGVWSGSPIAVLPEVRYLFILIQAHPYAYLRPRVCPDGTEQAIRACGPCWLILGDSEGCDRPRSGELRRSYGLDGAWFQRAILAGRPAPGRRRHAPGASVERCGHHGGEIHRPRRQDRAGQ